MSRRRGSGVFAPGRSEGRAVLAGAVALTVAGAGSAVALGPGADADRAVVLALFAVVAAAYAAVGVLVLVGRRRARVGARGDEACPARPDPGGRPLERRSLAPLPPLPPRALGPRPQHRTRRREGTGRVMARLYAVPPAPAGELRDDPPGAWDDAVPEQDADGYRWGDMPAGIGAFWTGDVDPRAAGLPAAETWRERVETLARAADDAAASTEDAIRQVKAQRVALLGGHRGAADEAARGLLAHLGALAGVLGELHVGLDELDTTPGGAA